MSTQISTKLSRDAKYTEYEYAYVTVCSVMIESSTKLIYKTCTVKLSIRLSTTPRPEAPRVLYISTVYSGCILHLHSLVPGGKVRSAQ